MKKLSVYALTAATALAVTGLPLTAYGASGTYGMKGGNQKMVVIGGNNINDLKDLIGQVGQNITLPDCDPNLPNFPETFQVSSFRDPTGRTTACRMRVPKPGRT